MDYTAIPKELTKLKQWVCVRADSKLPFTPATRRPASSSDPGTWGTFVEATALVERGIYDGIGFVFANNGLVGIDIDVGFFDGFLTPICADIMRHCESYTEYSRSGRGVHILLQGKLPFSGRNNMNGVEIYQSQRYFICTGKALIFRTLRLNQQGIDYVLERYFPAKADTATGNRIYNPVWQKPTETSVQIRPIYPEIYSGGRNISLTSIAGQMWRTGYTKEQIYEELVKVNAVACQPPLPERELKTICRSVSRYKRGDER